MEEFISKATVVIQAPLGEVWRALITPELISRYMIGTKVIADWREGGDITWQGEYEGNEYKDKGKIIKLEPNKILSYSHFSPLSGKLDVKENYHVITIELFPENDGVRVRLTQDNNISGDVRDDSARFWQNILQKLKEMLEK